MAVCKNFLKINGYIFIILFIPMISWAACTGSSPTWYSTPDYSSISSCVSKASGGDTINVSVGSATWTSTLNITKGINLIGAGIGNTVITNGIGSEQYMIKYNSPSNSAYFRVSGFTFDLNTVGKAISMSVYSEPTVPLIRIDHNRFVNSKQVRAIWYGGVFGVVDNNIFDNIMYPFGANFSAGKTWAAYDDDWLGTNLNFYVEDNVFNSPPYDWPQIEADYGARWAFRYNTIDMTTDHYSFTDNHGGRGGNYGAMGAEMYGNYITCNGYQIMIMDDRGGRATGHHNNIINADASSFFKVRSQSCPTAEPIERQKHNNTYHFQNRFDTTGKLMDYLEWQDDCGDIIENATFWMDNTGCIGGCSSISSGVGCGSALPDKCTPSSDVNKGSTAFWLTEQSCTSLSGLTGASTEVKGGNRNPSSKIEGTLYICTAPDTWTAWYTPYTYPHPLRTDDKAKDGPPSPPKNLKIIH